MFNNATACFCYSNISQLDNDRGKHSDFLHVITFSTSIAVAILSPVVLVSNALVLAAIWRNPSLRTPSYILLAGLAFTDFCTGFITQPFYAAMKLIYLVDLQLKTVVKRPAFLIIKAIANGSAIYLTSMTMSIITVMSIERWLHMSRRSLITVRRAYYTVAGLFLFHIPHLVYRVLYVFNNTIYLPGIDITANSFLIFCLIFTSIAYFKVFKKIRSHQQQIQVTYFSQASGQPAINFAKYKKSVFTILYILAIFYVSYIPLAIAFGILIVWGSEKEPAFQPFFDVVMLFVFLSPSLNPVLYMWRMNDIRNEVTTLVKRIFCKVG